MSVYYLFLSISKYLYDVPGSLQNKFYFRCFKYDTNLACSKIYKIATLSKM